ncbi:MAG: YchJ family protein [Marinifilaceae bacterium]
MENCPCGLKKSYQDCCGSIIEGRRIAGSPEELMRSRYSAFVKQETDYLMRTHVAEYRPVNSLEISEWNATVEWLGLEVLHTSCNDEVSGWVEFKAHFRENGKRSVIHENSFFRKEEEHWLYVNGETPLVRPAVKNDKVERNAPCPCGSGKKYKKCCMKG